MTEHRVLVVINLDLDDLTRSIEKTIGWLGSDGWQVHSVSYAIAADADGRVSHREAMVVLIRESSGTP
jgi:hypothetical protein